METGRQGASENSGASRVWKGESVLIKLANHSARTERQFCLFCLTLQLITRAPPGKLSNSILSFPKILRRSGVFTTER